MSLRLVPAAVTPVTFSDIGTAVIESLLQKDSVDQFRSALATYFGGKYTYTFSSFMRATYACLISLKKLDRGKRKYVILPRYSCPSFAHAILAAGLKIEYCDVNPETLSIEMKSFKSKLSEKVLAIIVSNLFGLSNPIDEIMILAQKYKINVLEGADYGLGSEFKGKKVGSFGDFTILNFQEGKAIPIGGGAIVSKNHTMAEWNDATRPSYDLIRIPLMIAYSIFTQPWAYGLLIRTLQLLKINRKALSMEDTIRGTNSETDFEFDASENMPAVSAFQATLGSKILARLNQDLKIRQQKARKLAQALDKIQSVTLIKPHPGVNKIHFIRYPILVTHQREALIKRLLDQGIEASPMYIEHGMKIKATEFPGAKKIADSLVTLPCHVFMDQASMTLTATIVKDTLCT